MASFWNLVETGKHYKTHPDMKDVFGGFTPACREYERPRLQEGSTVLGAIPAGTVFRPVLHFIVVNNWGTYGIELDILSPSNPERNSYVMQCRGMNRCIDEAFVPKSEYNNASRELITEKAVEAIEPCSAPCSRDWKQSRTEETCADGSHCHEEPVGYTTSTIAVRGRNWEIVPEFGGPQPPLKTAISKFVMKLLRHCDQEERDPDGATQ